MQLESPTTVRGSLRTGDRRRAKRSVGLDDQEIATHKGRAGAIPVGSAANYRRSREERGVLGLYAHFRDALLIEVEIDRIEQRTHR